MRMTGDGTAHVGTGSAAEASLQSNCFGEQRNAQSSDGVQIAYWKAGNPDGYPIVFLHGFLFDHRAFALQFADPRLAEHFCLIALDQRGHGQSGRPTDATAYASGQLWADDLATVLNACHATDAIVVAWSFGGRMLNDYLRHYGTSRVAGVNYVAAATLADPVAIGADHQLLTESCSADPAIASAAESALVEKVLGTRPGTDDHALGMAVVGSARREDRLAMRSRALDYDALLGSLTVPALISHGTQDSFVKPVLASRLGNVLNGSVVSMYEGVGHAPFIEAADRFNTELGSFAKRHLPAS